MDNYQYAELKDAIKRIDLLEKQIERLKTVMLNSLSVENLSRSDEKFLYSEIGSDVLE